jgi:hypothetical protein
MPGKLLGICQETLIINQNVLNIIAKLTELKFD